MEKGETPAEALSQGFQFRTYNTEQGVSISVAQYRRGIAELGEGTFRM
jgi:hypothetical protein